MIAATVMLALTCVGVALSPRPVGWIVQGIGLSGLAFHVDAWPMVLLAATVCSVQVMRSMKALVEYERRQQWDVAMPPDPYDEVDGAPEDP